MSVIVFGKQDLLAIPKISTGVGPLSGDIAYTHPSLDIFYSSYGFAFPLDYEGLPLHLHMDNLLPKPSEYIQCLMPTLTYLLIDHQGLIWKVTLVENPKEPGRYWLSPFYIDTSTHGWWMNSGADLINNTDRQFLQGYLYTDPSQDEIEQFHFTYSGSRTIWWFKISEIVTKLNQVRPKESEDVKFEKAIATAIKAAKKASASS